MCGGLAPSSGREQQRELPPVPKHPEGDEETYLLFVRNFGRLLHNRYDGSGGMDNKRRE